MPDQPAPEPAPARRGGYIPYLIGLFLLTPFVVWAVLWTFAFPGIKNGFERDVAVALFAVSVPLVAWFFLSSIGFIANSVAGDDEFKQPSDTSGPPDLTALPFAAPIIGVAATAYLLVAGHPWLIGLSPAPAQRSFRLRT
ncbi:MAG: hypothetical protein HC834_04180 [Rhodospirillales bacterium]|nr:hypothetical protein [Rhodospirillales bacterium]